MIINTDCLNYPVLLHLRQGGLFKADSFRGKRHVRTKFFLITKINKEKHCVTLMLLRHCRVCCDQLALVPTYETITVDIGSFCGYQKLPKYLIRRCNHQPIEITDCHSGVFRMSEGLRETVLWYAEIEEVERCSVDITIKFQQNKGLELRLYFLGQDGYQTYPLDSNQLAPIRLDDCRKIKLVRADSKEMISGTFLIEYHCQLIAE